MFKWLITPSGLQHITQFGSNILEGVWSQSTAYLTGEKKKFEKFWNNLVCFVCYYKYWCSVTEKNGRKRQHMLTTAVVSPVMCICTMEVAENFSPARLCLFG